MKVFALNSSPRSGGQSKTGILLNHLVRGMREGGAEVEVVELRKKTVKSCIGCFTCWTKTPGVCIHPDDMTHELFPKWLDSDLSIYATPLYHFHMNGVMKTFIERTLPLLQPFFRSHDERTFHPLRKSHPKVVFLSVAGFPEDAIFAPLSAWANFVYGRHGNLVAEIYRPFAETLSTPFFKDKWAPVLEAVARAGKEIVLSGKVADATQAQIQKRILDDPTAFLKMGNLMWKTCIAEGITPKEFEERGIVPRPDSIETFMMILSAGFKPQAAAGLKAILQFQFSGEVQGFCHFKIEDQKMEAFAGPSPNATLTIEAPFELWMDIMTGKADGQKMFMEQRYKVAGDLALLIRMNQLFGK